MTDKQMHQAHRPKDDIGDITFEDLFDIKDIQRLQDEFADATGVASIITHTDGTPITAPSNFCRLCNDIIRKTDKGRENCFKSDALIGRYHPEGPIIKQCTSGGLWDAGAGITVGGKHIANWLIGQVRDESQTDEGMCAYAREIRVDEGTMIEAFKEVPSMSRDQFGKIARMLFTLAEQLSTAAYLNVQQERIITKTKQLKNKLSRSEATLKSIFRAAPIGIGMVVNRILTWANEHFVEMIGYRRNELIGNGSRMFYLSKNEFERVGRELYAQIEQKGTCMVETRWQRKDGQIIDVVLRSTPLNPSDLTEGVTFTALDITQRKQAEKQLEQSERNYREIFNAATDVFMIHDKKTGAIVDVNSQVSEMYGYDPSELLGGTVENLSSGVPPYSPVEASDWIKKAIEEGPQLFEWMARHKNGKIFWVEVGLKNATIGGVDRLLAIIRDIRTRKETESELKEYRQHLENLVKKRTAALEAKNKELETFTYSVSHDLKAPLRGIDGYSRLLENEYADKLDEEGLHFLKNVRTATEQMNQLIEDLLTYSRMERRDLSFMQIDIPLLIDELLFEREHEITSRCVQVRIEMPLKHITCDRDSMRQILGNLLDNAIKFTQERSDAVIEINGSETDKCWKISVKDNGIGFDAKYQGRIFGIFQRLHRIEEYPGTGVGLALVQKAVQRMGGTVRAESEPGSGAVFCVEIPKSQNLNNNP